MTRAAAAACIFILGIAIGVGTTAWFFDRRAPVPVPDADSVERARLQAAYGPTKQSQGIEEWIVRDFFHDRRGGFFLDVGAADYKTSNNTWYLENRLGWSGIAIDAQQEYRAGYEQYRPRTRFFSVFVSDRPDGTATLFISSGKGASSSKRAFTARHGTVGESIEVPTTTLNQLLDVAGVTNVDFVSMDIKLAEPKALAGFDINRFKPALVAVELHPEARQQILDYFAAHSYVGVGKYLHVDDTNAWFMPAGTAVDPFPFNVP